MKQEIGPQPAEPLYDAYISENYDTFYKTSETGLFLRDFLPQHIKGRRVLDVGCGTGWLLDYQKGVLLPENYVGVDVSLPMARKLKEKHAEYNVINGDVRCIRGKFDTCLGIFGPLSYMEPAEVEHLSTIIDEKIFLMGYNQDAFSKILKKYKRPFVKGETYPTTRKYEILRNKFPDIRVYELSEYVVFTNFDNAEEIKIFNDAKKEGATLTKTA